ncbi:hypothetical protein GCM10010341_43250 [Streptomyces noursei]|nr:hypothetical protein GCM10010341_43250 [Streptomyces noursei]
MRALAGRVPGPVHDRLGVPGDVADAGIDLIEGETKLRHPASVIVFLTQWGVRGATRPRAAGAVTVLLDVDRRAAARWWPGEGPAGLVGRTGPAEAASQSRR